MREHGSTPLMLGLVEVSHPLTEQDPCKDSPSHHKPTTFAKQVFTLITRNLDHAHDEKRPASLCLEKCARVCCYFCGLSIVWQKLYKTRDQKRINQWRMVQLISHVTCSLKPLKVRTWKNPSRSQARNGFCHRCHWLPDPKRGCVALVRMWGCECRWHPAQDSWAPLQLEKGDAHRRQT